MDNGQAQKAASSPAPQVSFIIASYNARPYLEAAVGSALAQQGVSFEVLIVDDGSQDGSLEDARRLAARDPRVRVLQTPQNAGPGGARNVALDAMAGEWCAILDSDDLVLPDRSRVLLAAAEKQTADVIADNVIVFGDGIQEHVLLPDLSELASAPLTLDAYFERSCLFAKAPGLGFLKPMIRRSTIERLGLRYNEKLRIGEDDELIVRLLFSGARYVLLPDAFYRYRKHGNSISHRLSVANAELMMAGELQVKAMIGKVAQGRAYQRRWTALVRGLAFTASVAFLKEGRLGAAMLAIVRHPRALFLYHMPIRAALARSLRRQAQS